MKKILLLIFCLVFTAQTTFAGVLFKDIPYKDNWKKIHEINTDEPSDGILYNGERLRVAFGRNHYMNSDLKINKIKPNSFNLITVVVNDIQIISFKDFTGETQPFYIWTDSRIFGDPHINFFSIDLTTGKPNEDVFVQFTNAYVS